MPKTDPKSVNRRFQELKDQRSQWEPLWKDIRDYIAPDLGIFTGEENMESNMDKGCITAEDVAKAK